MLARFLRSGDNLTPIWVPRVTDEAIPNLRQARGRELAFIHARHDTLAQRRSSRYDPAG